MTCRSLLLSLLPLLAAVLPLHSQTYDELCERAVRAAAVDSLDEATACINRALAREPDNPRNAILLSNLGNIQRRQELFLEAFDSYARALELAPLATAIWLNRASLNLYLERYAAARDDYTRVLDLERDNQTALLMRAFINMKQSDYGAARRDYKRLLRIAPFSYSGRLGLATLERKDGRPEEALEILDGMIVRSQSVSRESDAERAALFIVRAGVLMDLKRPESALLDLEEGIRLDDTQPEAFLIRGQIYLSQKKKAKARDDFERAIALGIPHEDMLGLLQDCKE